MEAGIHPSVMYMKNVSYDVLSKFKFFYIGFS